jgi:tRNA1(Val) A37 N6-methylase TrmN6
MNGGGRKSKSRFTIDLSPQFQERIERLESLLESGGKANLVRDALRVYEFVAEKSLAGYKFKMIDMQGNEETLAFIEFFSPG